MKYLKFLNYHAMIYHQSLFMFISFFENQEINHEDIINLLYKTFYNMKKIIKKV